MQIKGLNDPYGHLDQDLVSRLQADISNEDLALIRSVVPFRGVLQSTVNTLIHSICNELRELNIRSYDPDHLNTYVAIVQRRANSRLAGQTADGNDRGGVEGIHNPSPQPSSPTSGTEKRTNIRAKGRQSKR